MIAKIDDPQGNIKRDKSPIFRQDNPDQPEYLTEQSNEPSIFVKITCKDIHPNSNTG